MDHEKLFVNVATNIVTEIFKSTFGHLVEFSGHKFSKSDFLYLKAQEYSENMYRRFNYIKILGSKDEMLLTDLYVRINVLDQATREIYERNLSLSNVINLKDPELILEDLKLQDQRERDNKSSEYAEKVVDKLEKVIVLGKPGAGKTTLLKHLALQNISDNKSITRKKIPVFISLNRSSKDFSLINEIVKQFEICNIDNAELFVRKLLEEGKCIILLDGLDEIKETNINNIIDEINDFSDRYYKNKFIISCRIAFYNYWFPHFKIIEVADFNTEQINAFIKQWFVKEREVAEKCIQKIKESPHLHELASTPLLLTLLCLNFDILYEFPNNRAQIYEQAVNALIFEWDSTRRVDRANRPSWMSHKLVSNLLSSIAFETFKESEYLYPKKRLVTFIENYIRQLSNFNSLNSEFDSLLILSVIKSNHGLFIERANNIYSYSHLTIQEYFCAQFIAENINDVDLRYLINEYLLNQNWREVLIVIANLLFDASQYLGYIHAKLKRVIQSNTNLYNLVKEIQFITLERNQDFRTRILVLSIILNHAVDYSKAYYMKDEIKKSITKLETCANIAQRLSTEVKFDTVEIKWAGNAASSLERASSLTSDITLFSELLDYLKGLSILIECMNSGLYLKKDSMKKIELEILTLS